MNRGNPPVRLMTSATRPDLYEALRASREGNAANDDAPADAVLAGAYRFAYGLGGLLLLVGIIATFAK